MSEPKYIPLVLTAHEDGYTATREIPMECMLNPDDMKRIYEELAEILDAYIESSRTARFATKEAAEDGHPAIYPVLECVCAHGFEKRVNPEWKTAKYTVKRIPVERVIPCIGLEPIK